MAPVTPAVARSARCRATAPPTRAGSTQGGTAAVAIRSKDSARSAETRSRIPLVPELPPEVAAGAARRVASTTVAVRVGFDGLLGRLFAAARTWCFRFAFCFRRFAWWCFGFFTD